MPEDLVIHSDFPLREHNTFGIEAKAHRYVAVTSLNILQRVSKLSELSGLRRFVLGGGSNIVLTADFPGLVLHMGIMGVCVVGEDANYTYVKACAGENWHQFVQWTLTQGLGGLENLSLIPGSVGAAPIQNIGAYGAEVKDCLYEVTVFEWATGETRTLGNAECGFGYRDSVFKHALLNQVVILDVSFALPKQWQANLRYAELQREIDASGVNQPSARNIGDAVIAIRTRKLPDPAAIGNAGSFFKNPIVSADKLARLLVQFPQLISYSQADGTHKLAAGWLIERCGWKGRRLGAAGVFERQALVLVNHGGARGSEIAGLAQAIRRDVLDRFGIELEVEPILV